MWCGFVVVALYVVGGRSCGGGGWVFLRGLYRAALRRTPRAGEARSGG